MRGERTTDRDALANRYGLSARLAARVVALLARKTDVTQTLLEMAASDRSLEKVLLDASLLTDPQGFDEQRLRELAREAGFAECDLLRLVGGEQGWRTIALEDDLLAEQAEAVGDAGPLESTAVVRAARAAISRPETEELFTPEEVARLKLAALTSQDMDERVEALRKLVFAPLGAGQKASIFVNVLIDSAADVRVRREAVRDLEQIGFRSDLAEAIRRLFEPQAQEVLYAVRRLGMLLREAEDAEVGVVLAVILGIFEEDDRQPVVLELLHLTGQAAGILTQSRQRTEQFIQAALRHLAGDFDALFRHVEEAIRAIHRQASEAVDELLWREIERSTDARVQGFLIHLVGSLTEDPARREELARVAVAAILNPQLPEDQRSHLRYGLVRLGEPAVRMVLQRMEGNLGAAGPELVRLLDVVCTEGEVSVATVNQAMRRMLDVLQVGDRATRRRILEASLAGDPRVGEPLQRELADELLSHMTEWRLPTTVEAISRTLEKIGIPALVPLVDYVRRRHPHEDAEAAFLSMGRIIRQQGKAVPPELGGEVLDYCMSLLEDKRARGGFTIALASVCGYAPGAGSRFDDVLRAMKDRLWKTPYTLDLFEALGILAGSDNAEPRHQQELFELFDHILELRAPDVLGVRRTTPDGTVYEFGAEVLFDTRIVPAMVRGLERIGAGSGTPEWLRKEVVKRLLVLWEGVSNVRVVWGPAAVEALIHAVCSAACCPQVTTDMRVRLGRSMLDFLNKVSVVRSMGDVCSTPDAHQDMQALCLEAGERMLSEWEHCDQQDEERKAALLKSMAQTAANAALDARDPAVQRLRGNVVEALFQGLREGIREVHRPLELLRDCPHLSEQQREEIRERLSRAFGLVRAAEG